MNAGIAFLNQIQDTGGEFGGWVSTTFRQIVGSITGGYHVEHNLDDTHSTIHATGSIAERGRATAMGDWIAVPYASVTFTDSNGAAWTVSSSDYAWCEYTLIGSTFMFQVKLATTSVVGGATQLNMTIPGNFTSVTDNQFGTYHYVDNGTKGVGLWSAVTDGTGVQLQFSKMDFTTNWAAAVNTTEIRASGAFQLTLNT